MRSALRTLAWVFATLAAALLTRDLYKFWETGSFAPLSLGFVWHTLHATSLQLAEAAISRHVHPFLWHPVTVTILLWPAFAVFAGCTALCFLAGRKPKRDGPTFRAG